MTAFTPWEGLAGGVMIGIAVIIWLALYGRVTGISGIVGGAFWHHQRSERSWRWFYLAGLVAGAGVYLRVRGALAGTYFLIDLQVGWWQMAVAGLLVGFGTRMSHGCTSGHGVCGLARLSSRSLVATVTFMLFGFATVFVLRHVVGAV